MSTAHPPSQAPALDPRPAPAVAPAEGQTLTLQLRLVPGAMSGRMVVRGVAVPADALRVRVAMPAHAPWTYTP